MLDTKEPTLPAVNIAKVVELRKRMQELLVIFKGRQLIGQDFTEFVHDLHTLIPSSLYSTLLRSVQHLAGVVLTDVEFGELAWRLAGNVHHLRKSVVVPPWSQQLFTEWCPVQITNISKCRVRVSAAKHYSSTISKKYAQVDLLFLAGLPAGKTITKLFSEAFLFHPSIKKIFGFSKYDRAAFNRYYVGEGNFPMRDLAQLVKLRFFALVEPSLSDKGEPDFVQLKSNGGTLRWNKALHKRRSRIEFKCPMQYDERAVPCYDCKIGYDKCASGCHSRTYSLAPCRSCGRAEAKFDSIVHAELCVDCYVHRHYER
jgi:hypothetical protein